MAKEIHMSFVDGAWNFQTPESDELWTDGRSDLDDAMTKARVFATTHQVPIRITHKDGRDEIIPVERLR